jgi:L-lactate dehydrogenase complex protein LldG
MSTARSEILDRIRDATGGTTQAREAEYAAIPRDYVRVGSLDTAAKLELLVDRLHDYGATVFHARAGEVASAVSTALKARAKTSLLIPRDLPRVWLPDEFHFFREGPNYLEVDASEGVLTDCALAIASTGSIVLRHSAGEARRALSLIPDYHLCVVFAAQVVETVPEGIHQMKAFANIPITTIAGPSATADIEMIRVKGVHGPRILDVILVDTTSPPYLESVGHEENAAG